MKMIFKKYDFSGFKYFFQEELKIPTLTFICVVSIVEAILHIYKDSVPAYSIDHLVAIFFGIAASIIVYAMSKS